MHQTGSRKLARWTEALACPHLSRCVAQLERRLPDVHPADWVAAYVLLCLARIFPAGCVGGRRTNAAQNEDLAVWRDYPETLVCLAEGPRRYTKPLSAAGTLRCADVDGLVLSERDLQKLGGIQVPVVDVFARFELLSVPTWANRSIVAWAAGLRPLILMTRAADVEELMEMQGEGRRCVTCFCKASELGREWTDLFAPYAVKDSLHFTLHDLQHGEKFVDPELYFEQVGFLRAMRQVWAWFKEKKYHVPTSLDLRRAVAHVMSDMNCCSVQMLDFLLAQWQGSAGASSSP